MIRLPPRSTRTDTLFPYTTLFRSGVTATIITDSDGARLVLKGGVGEDAAFTLTNGGGADANLARFTWDGSTGGMSQVRAAQNAVVVLDGVETSFSGNTIVDALPNVTIDLMKAAEEIGRASCRESVCQYV